MSFGAPRRTTGGAGSGHSGDSYLTAVIIGEPLLSSISHITGNGMAVSPLAPISPSSHTPSALLPICNTPIIDYILENLVLNGVNEAVLLLNPASYPKVRQHLAECRTARGKPWLKGDSIKVSVVRSSRYITKLADAVGEMREQNLVPQSGSFLFVPIDTMASCINLREYYAKHLERVRTVGKYAATLICTNSRPLLDATLRNVLVHQLAKTEDNAEVLSPIANSGIMGVRETTDYLLLRPYAAPPLPKQHHTMFVLNRSTNVVTYMARFEVGEEAPEPPVLMPSNTVRQSVRMDLLPTGLLFCCCEAVPLIEFHIKDIYSFLSTSLLGQTEIYGNVFGVVEAPSNVAIIEAIDSVEAYLQSNLDVCARRFFPMTRESCFAEAFASYAVSATCETVYLHTTAKCTSFNIGPNVVVGEGVYVPADVELAGAVLGKGVQIGEGSSILSCVVMEGAKIGQRCSLRGCVIGPGAVILDRADLTHVVVGEGCIIDGVAEDGTALVLQNQTILCNGASDEAPTPGNSCSSTSTNGENETEHWLVGPGGRGYEMKEHYANMIQPTSMLFTDDPVARPSQSSDDDDETEEDDNDVFRMGIQRHVAAALLQPSRIESSSYDMSTICLSNSFGYPELCELVTELLMEHVMTTNQGKAPAEMVEAARMVFHTWCRPFYNTFLSKNNEANIEAMTATLEGLCSSIANPKCPLHAHGPPLVEILYNGCDDDMYDERGYCIVSGESLITFEKEMSHRRQVLQRYTSYGHRPPTKAWTFGSSSSSSSSDDDDDSDESRDLQEEGKVIVAASCSTFIMGVKAFLGS